jgi:calcium-binding protein CML
MARRENVKSPQTFDISQTKNQEETEKDTPQIGKKKKPHSTNQFPTHTHTHTVDRNFARAMGLCASNNKTAPKVKSEFDKRVTAALQRFQKTAKDKPKSERVTSFNQTLLRSARIVKALSAVKEVFQKFDADSSGGIDHTELGAALEVLGNKMTPEELSKVFHEADLYDNNKLSEKEFVVCLLLGYVLDDLKLTTSTELPAEDAATKGAEGTEDGPKRLDTTDYFGHAKELQWAFNNITGCYLLFDVDASGDLSRDEVMKQLSNKTGVFADAAAASMLSEDRWKELDWDGDGEITFKEFIWAFQGWITTDTDEN